MENSTQQRTVTTFGVLGKNDRLTIYMANQRSDPVDGQIEYTKIWPGSYIGSYVIVKNSGEQRRTRYITKNGRTIFVTNYTNAIEFHFKSTDRYIEKIDLCVFPDNRVLPRSGTPLTLPVEIDHDSFEVGTGEECNGATEVSTETAAVAKQSSGVVRNVSMGLLVFMYMMYYMTAVALLSDYLSREAYIASMMVIVGGQWVFLLDIVYDKAKQVERTGIVERIAIGEGIAVGEGIADTAEKKLVCESE